MVTKSVSLLPLQFRDDEGVAFGRVMEEEDDQMVLITMTPGRWQELGEPSELTVTIEPGDLLNVEEVADAG